MQNVNFYIKNILTFIITISILNINAQSTCLEKIELSKRKFNEGDFVKSLNFLIEIEKKIECNLSRNERENILTLIVRNLIELDRIEEIDMWDKKLYENNPNFEPKKDILEEDFMLHLSNHYAKPKIDVSSGFGIRNTIVERLKTYSIYENLNYVNSQYESEPEISFTFSIGYIPFKNHKFLFSSGFHKMSTERSFQGYLPDYNVLFKEEIESLSIGFNYIYQFHLNKNLDISPFVGYQINFFTDIENDIILSAPSNQSNQILQSYYSNNNQIITAEIKELDRKNSRISSGNYLNLGFDLSFRINRFSIFLNSSFQYGFENFVLPEKRYENYQLVYEFYYLDEDFRLHFITTKLGFRYNLKYKIK